MKRKNNDEGLKTKKFQNERSKYFPFIEAELLKEMTPENAHIDLLAQLLTVEKGMPT